MNYIVKLARLGPVDFITKQARALEQAARLKKRPYSKLASDDDSLLSSDSKEDQDDHRRKRQKRDSDNDDDSSSEDDSSSDDDSIDRIVQPKQKAVKQLKKPGKRKRHNVDSDDDSTHDRTVQTKAGAGKQMLQKKPAKRKKPVEQYNNNSYDHVHGQGRLVVASPPLPDSYDNNLGDWNHLDNDGRFSLKLALNLKWKNLLGDCKGYAAWMEEEAKGLIPKVTDAVVKNALATDLVKNVPSICHRHFDELLDIAEDLFERYCYGAGHNKLWRKRVLFKMILHAKFWIGKDPKYIWDHDSEPFDASKFVVTRFLEPFETGTGEEMYKEMSLDNVCSMIISKYERRRQSKKAREAKAAAAAARGE